MLELRREEEEASKVDLYALCGWGRGNGAPGQIRRSAVGLLLAPNAPHLTSHAESPVCCAAGAQGRGPATGQSQKRNQLHPMSRTRKSASASEPWIEPLFRLWYGFMGFHRFGGVSPLHSQSDRALISTEEAADILGMSADWLRDRQEEIGTGPDFFRVGRLIKYRRDDIDRWLESQRNKKP